MLTPKEELQDRLVKLQQVLQENNCDGALIIQNVDLFYYSGTMQNAQLYVPVSGEPVLLCRKSCNRARTETSWSTVPVKSFKEIPEKLVEARLRSPERLALEFDVLPAVSYLFYQQLFPGTELIDASGWIRNQRAVKSPYEIDLMRQAGEKMAQVYANVPKLLKPGITEVAFAGQVEAIARELGHQGTIRVRGYNQELFYGHCLAGESGGVASYFDGPTGGTGLGPFFPQGAGPKVIRENEPLSLDYVGVFNGYLVDQTKLFAVKSLPEKLIKAFQAALEIQAAVIDRVKPGAMGNDLYQLAVDIAEQAGLAEHFMGYGQDRAKFIGHGVGLELDEMPVLAKGFRLELQQGMAFALEPKFVFPDLGVAGIENTFVVTERGVEKLTPTPDELVIV
jgi:Xaa-Pro aminopeptidase